MDNTRQKNLIRIIVAIVLSLVIIAIPLTVKLVVDSHHDVEDSVPQGGDDSVDTPLIPPNDDTQTDNNNGDSGEVIHPETVSVRVEIGCHRLFDESGASYIEDVERRLGEELFRALNGGDMVPLEDITLPYDSTVMDATKSILKAHGIAIAERGGYISSIGGLGEKMAGAMSGWVYLLNGKSIMAGASSVRLREGDTVTWIYLVG